MVRPHSTVTLSVRVPIEIRTQLEELAHATGRKKSFLATEAIENYLAVQAWQVQAIKQAVHKADRGDAKFIEHQKVVDWLATWGSSEERDIPE